MMFIQRKGLKTFFSALASVKQRRWDLNVDVIALKIPLSQETGLESTDKYVPILLMIEGSDHPRKSLALLTYYLTAYERTTINFRQNGFKSERRICIN